MRTPQFDADALLPLFRRRQIVTMDEMKATLGTAVDRTVFRKLREFPYHSSYSHRGKFYTLDALAEFQTAPLKSPAVRSVRASLNSSSAPSKETGVTQKKARSPAKSNRSSGR